MQVNEMIREGKKRLEQAGVEDAASCARLLCCFVMDVEPGVLPLRHREEVSREDLVRFRELIERKAAGEPLQYITGEVDFLGLKLKVDSRALIPRPETELLVEEAVRVLEHMVCDDCDSTGTYRTADACDLCCGSGAVGLALARLWEEKHTPPIHEPPITAMGSGMSHGHTAPELTVTLTDISCDALSLAKENAERLRSKNVLFAKGDLFEPLQGRTFDLIVSNPPYIPTEDIQTLQTEIRDHEPSLALDGGEDGLDIYRRIIRGAPDHLNPGGALIVEIGSDQAEHITDIVHLQKAFETVRTVQDLAGLDRIIIAHLSR